MAEFNVNEISKKAEEALLRKNGVPSESRQIFEQTLFEWVDLYQEEPEPQTPQQISSLKAKEDAIVGVWLYYTSMEKRLRQFKQAKKVYESAVTCAVAERSAKVWIDYARFCRERGKMSNARKVYLRGLATVVRAEEKEALWQDFHVAVRETGGDPSLTLEGLKQAVAKMGGAAASVGKEDEVESSLGSAVVPDDPIPDRPSHPGSNIPEKEDVSSSSPAETGSSFGSLPEHKFSDVIPPTSALIIKGNELLPAVAPIPPSVISSSQKLTKATVANEVKDGKATSMKTNMLANESTCASHDKTSRSREGISQQRPKKSSSSSPSHHQFQRPPSPSHKAFPRGKRGREQENYQRTNTFERTEEPIILQVPHGGLLGTAPPAHHGIGTLCVPSQPHQSHQPQPHQQMNTRMIWQNRMPEPFEMPIHQPHPGPMQPNHPMHPMHGMTIGVVPNPQMGAMPQFPPQQHHHQATFPPMQPLPQLIRPVLPQPPAAPLIQPPPRPILLFTKGVPVDDFSLPGYLIEKMQDILRQGDLIYDILEGLRNLQFIKEDMIIQAIKDLENKHNALGSHMQHMHEEREKLVLENSRGAPVEHVRIINNEELNSFLRAAELERVSLEVRIVEQLNQVLRAQQEILMQAGVPMMFPNATPEELVMQQQLVRYLQADSALKALARSQREQDWAVQQAQAKALQQQQAMAQAQQAHIQQAQNVHMHNQPQQNFQQQHPFGNQRVPAQHAMLQPEAQIERKALLQQLASILNKGKNNMIGISQRLG